MVFGESHFRELWRVAALLMGTEHYRPVIVFAYRYAALARDQAVCREAKVSWLCFEAPPVPGGGHAGLQTLPGLLVALSRRLSHARRLIAEQAPALLVFAVDYPGCGSAEFIRAGHDAGVPSVIVPFSIANHEEALCAYGHDIERSDRVWTNRVVGWLFPRWRMRLRGRSVLRERASFALALELLGLAPPLPWVQNSSQADAVTVESLAMLDYYRRSGLDEGRLVLTGALYNDLLCQVLTEADQRREALYAELGLPAGKPMILVSLPPPIQIEGRDCEFILHDEWLEVLVAEAARAGDWNVVLCLHPMLPIEACAWLERDGVRIARQDTASLVPLSALYVACVSATIRWAIACGIPCVNYDAYACRYSDYREVPGVYHVETAAEYTDVLQRLTTDRAFYEAAVAAQAEVKDRWALFDGGNASRLLALVDRLCGVEDAHREPAGDASGVRERNRACADGKPAGMIPPDTGPVPGNG
ncbi:protein of unknown function (plasmid) [Azospirillum lipoferum 4B]|uniref:Uncharacterized protein n=1 Tax=Azospirillum lipoferum (strain 4B) TaxID=862719 RepID=G7ZIN3_AZOL4|nr:protein of unknown function [Azospirillum lipoferum 4B]